MTPGEYTLVHLSEWREDYGACYMNGQDCPSIKCSTFLCVARGGLHTILECPLHGSMSCLTMSVAWPVAGCIFLWATASFSPLPLIFPGLLQCGKSQVGPSPFSRFILSLRTAVNRVHPQSSPPLPSPPFSRLPSSPPFSGHL